MASIKSDVVKTTFIFSIVMNDSLQFNSPSLIVGKVPWRILFSRTEITSKNEKQDVIDVFLACDYVQEIHENIEWWIEAEAVLKLIAAKENKGSIDKVFPKTTFKDGCRILKLIDFVKYKDLVDTENGYYRNGMFDFECTITMSPLFKETFPIVSYGVKCTSKQFIMVIENIKDFKTIDSEKFVIRGITWYVRFKKNEDKLAIYLFKDGGHQNFALAFPVSFKVQILPASLEDSAPIEHAYKTMMMSSDTNRGWPDFEKWEILFGEEKKYVRNNRAIFNVVIEVGQMEPIWKVEDSLNAKAKASSSNCPVCYIKFENLEVVAGKCGHLFCTDCIKAAIERNQECPICKGIVSIDDLRKIYFN